MPIVLLPITQCLCGSQPRPTVSTRVINLSVLIKGTVVAPEFIRLEQKWMKERTKERGKKSYKTFQSQSWTPKDISSDLSFVFAISKVNDV